MIDPPAQSSAPPPLSPPGGDADRPDQAPGPDGLAIALRCPHCRYDLTGTLRSGAGRCPECGRRFALTLGEAPIPLRAWLPLALSLAVAAGTGLTYPLFSWFARERLDGMGVWSLCLTGAAITALVLLLVTHRRYAVLSRAARWALVGLSWIVTLVFWGVWSDHVL